MNKIQLTWFNKFLLKYFPVLAMKRFARLIVIKKPVFEKAHEVFGEAGRIDFFPASNGRGLILIMDCETALFFYQNGDHFIYDGYEMGTYNKGDVTILDGIKRNIPMYP